MLCIICSCFKQRNAKIICKHIRINYFWTEIRCKKWYKRRRIGNRIRVNLQQKIYFLKYICTYIAQNNIFRKLINPMKYNVAIIIVFVQHFRNVLDSFEQIKFLLSYFQKFVCVLRNYLNGGLFKVHKSEFLNIVKMPSREAI